MFSTLRMLLVAATIMAVQSACLSSEWKQYGTMCYWRSHYVLTWLGAKNVCPSMFPGADLASVHNLQQDAFIATDLLGGNRAWLGLNCANGTASSCTWTDGTPYDYHNWYRSTTPNGVCTRGECCAYTNTNNIGDWFGNDCYDGYSYFVCQLNAS